MYRLFCLVTLCLVIRAVSCDEGRKFLLVFQPTYFRHTDGVCQIIINTNNPAQVSITTLEFTDYLEVDIGSYVYDTGCAIRAPTGYGDKGVIVESNVDITVQVYNDRYEFGDAYLALPSINEGADYIIATPPAPRIETVVDCLFAIVAEYHNTEIELYSPSPSGYELAEIIHLNRLGTYTRSDRPPYVEYTGYKISSSQPISVVTGSSIFQVNIAESCYNAPSYGFMLASPTVQAGYTFIVPKILKLNPGGYSGSYVRVISFTPDNLIEIPDQSIIVSLDEGEFFQHYISIWDEITRIECSDQCIVIMFNDVWCNFPDGGEGGFVMNVTPLERGTYYARFTAIGRADNGPMASYVTVISQTQEVLLDGEVITGWRSVPDWNYFEAAVPIGDGGHVLESADDGQFVAFVYGHEMYAPLGYGSQIVHKTSDARNQHYSK